MTLLTCKSVQIQYLTLKKNNSDQPFSRNVLNPHDLTHFVFLNPQTDSLVNMYFPVTRKTGRKSTRNDPPSCKYSLGLTYLTP